MRCVNGEVILASFLTYNYTLENLMKKTFASLLLLVLLCCLSVAGIASAETLTIWGSATCQKRFLDPGADALKAATGVNIKMIAVGSGKGVLALLAGKTTVAASSNDLNGTIVVTRRAANKQGKEIAIPDNLQVHTIFSDDIVPIVHKNNPVETLSWSQLKGIYTGTISNWKEVGGNDLPIRVVTTIVGSSTREIFQEKVMDKEEFVNNAVVVTITRYQLNEVSKYSGAIGVVSKGFYDMSPQKTRVVKADTISRPLALVTIGNPTPTVQKVIDFFRSEEGKKCFR